MSARGSSVPQFLGSSVLVPLVAVMALTMSLSAQQGPDRTKPPALGPAPTLTLPPIQDIAIQVQ